MKLRTRHVGLRCAFVALLPGAIVVFLIAVLFGAGPLDFVPIWNDEVVYWNETAVFAKAGWGGGYITVHEQAAELSRFGPHGPAFAVFHGGIGRVFGWHPYSAFLINLLVISLAAFVWLRGASQGPSPAIALLLASFWPLLLYLPTNMQESTHFAFAFLFSLSLGLRNKRAHGIAIAGTTILLTSAALMRPSWALMILPLGWLRARRKGPWAIALLVAATLAIVAVAYKAFALLASSGYPNSLNRLSDAWAVSVTGAVGMVGDMFIANLLRWFGSGEAWPLVAFRYFVVIFIVLLVVRCMLYRPPSHAHREVLELSLASLLPILAVVLLVGEVESWRDFRVLAPHVLVALLLLTAHTRWECWMWAGTLVGLPAYYHEFKEFHSLHFTADRTAIDSMRDSLKRGVRFIPGASPWTNTILMHAAQLQYPLLGLPLGIGVSYVLDWSSIPGQIRSEYLLLRPEDQVSLAGRARLIPVSETPLGMVYRNERFGSARPTEKVGWRPSQVPFLPPPPHSQGELRIVP